MIKLKYPQNDSVLDSLGKKIQGENALNSALFRIILY